MMPGVGALKRPSQGPLAGKSGDKRSDWTRHSVYWAIALVVVILIAIAGLLSTLRKWEQLGMARVTSRCLEIFNGWG